jgi:UPF0755 protein
MASKRKSSKKTPAARFAWWKTTLFCLGMALLVLGWMLSQSVFKDYPVQGRTQWLSIEKGQTYSSFIAKLGQDGQRFTLVLKLYQKLFIHQTMKVGVYQIKPGMSIGQVLVMLSDAENAHMNPIQVIEGTTFRQLKQHLLNDPNVKITLLNQPEAEVMRRLGSQYSHAEGWFAPNTYFFVKGETDANILQRLFDKQVTVLDQAWQQRAPNLPYQNQYQALIMASIIEKETGLAAERHRVAGVFVRRLQIGMRLQTDPTVIYGMGERYHGNITKADLRQPSAYNTYTIDGLPPTPIAMPSSQAIAAALHPDRSNALYFVATGQGGHTFSATLEQHNQAVAAYLKVLRARQQGS